MVVPVASAASATVRSFRIRFSSPLEVLLRARLYQTVGQAGPGLGGLRPHEAHALIHLFERGCAGLARLLGAKGKERAELGLVGAKLLVALLDRVEHGDDRL